MVNVAVIGMGWWGKALVTAMKKSDKLKVVMGMKRNPATEAEFARAEGFELVSDYGAVLKNKAVQALSSAFFVYNFSIKKYIFDLQLSIKLIQNR